MAEPEAGSGDTPNPDEPRASDSGDQSIEPSAGRAKRIAIIATLWAAAVVPLIVGLLAVLVLWSPVLSATSEQPSNDPAADLINQLVAGERANEDEVAKPDQTASEATVENPGDVEAMLEAEVSQQLNQELSSELRRSGDAAAVEEAVEEAVDQAVQNVVGEQVETVLEGAISDAIERAADEVDDNTVNDPLLESVDTVVEAAAEVEPLTRVGTVNVLGLRKYVVGAELLLIQIAVAAGLTGGALMTVIRTATGMDRGTAWPYVRWLAGAGLAVVLYLLIRGGLLNFGADGAALNPFTIAGLSALVGMFSENMTQALQRVMNALFNIDQEP